MWKILKKRRSTEGVVRPSILRKITGKVGAVQRRWADKLQEKSERLSVTGKKLMLGIFLAIFSGWSICIGWRSLSASHRGGTILVQPITISDPGQRGMGDQPDSARHGVSEKEYRAIQAFSHYLDSMGQSPEGKVWKDSLLKGRPGLLNSLQAIEHIYLNQSKR